jgi:hypothetical protein
MAFRLQRCQVRFRVGIVWDNFSDCFAPRPVSIDENMDSPVVKPRMAVADANPWRAKHVHVAPPPMPVRPALEILPLIYDLIITIDVAACTEDSIGQLYGHIEYGGDARLARAARDESATTAVLVARDAAEYFSAKQFAAPSVDRH